jgi:hypothetical protein
MELDRFAKERQADVGPVLSEIPNIEDVARKVNRVSRRIGSGCNDQLYHLDKFNASTYPASTSLELSPSPLYVLVALTSAEVEVIAPEAE